MSSSNENNPHTIVAYIGSPSTDNASMPVAYFPKKFRVLSVALINGAAIAASDTDFVQISLEYGSAVVIAELDSRAAHENGIAADVAEAMNIVEAQKDIAAGTSVFLNYNETDSGTAVALTGAQLCITGFYL